VKSSNRGGDVPGRAGYMVALAWVVLGSLLYAVEVLRLVNAIG
jgi:hypothetical protein